MKMDVGQVIVQSIHKGSKTKGPLPFPCLITHFCEEAGIEWNREGGNVITPTKEIGIKTYNELARRRGVRTIGANILDDDDMALNDEDLLEDDPDDEDFNAQNPDGDNNAGASDQDPSMVEMMRRMSVQLENNQQYLQTMNEQMTTYHNAYMGQFTDINQRLDTFQQGLVSHGINIPFVYRRETRRRVSTPPPPQDPDSSLPPHDPDMPYQGP